MTHRIKVLLLAMMAMMAMGAISASGAHAVTEFHSHLEKTTLTASQDGTGKTAHQVFDAGQAASITCQTVSGHATTSLKTVTTVQLTNIVYGGDCTYSTGGGATIDMNGCSYTFLSHGGAPNPGRVTIDCPVGSKIEVTGPCLVKIGAQGPLNSLKYHNIGSTADNTTQVTVEPNVTGIHYEASGIGCVKTGTGTDGAYTTGNAVVTGEVDQLSGGAMTSVWWS